MNIAPSRFACLLPALAAAACAVPQSPPPPPDRPVAAYNGAPMGDFRTVMLGVHNQTRADYGSTPLAWDETLAANAKAYAAQMARTGEFRHDRTPGRRAREGENIWRGSRGAYSYTQMLEGMVDERRFFRAGIFPDVSRTGDWSDVGHYTQMVWPTTTRLGCGVASDARYDYLVCRYAPKGNVDGTPMAAPRVLRPIR